ncbi:MAG: hypothetical protein JWN02_1889 [Acidobacteria bacterium]|nr:hypothetical protein [Acidobacteriota bacterium]
MRELICYAGGGGLLVLTLFDIVWTTLGTHGSGPVSGRITSGLWKLCVAIHRRRPAHRLLSFVGSVFLVLVVVWWLALAWLGWFLIFTAEPDSIIDKRTGAFATAEQRLTFVGSALFTTTSADFAANGSNWRIASTLTSAGGLASITLGITFLLQVLSAVVLKRSLAAYVSDCGGTATEILIRSWDGERIEGLDGHLIGITTMLHSVTEQHLAFPVLHYFHSEAPRTASSVRLAALYEMTVILHEGLVPRLRLLRISTQPLGEALTGYCRVMGETFVTEADHSPPPPSLQPLRDIGIELVSDEEFAQRLEHVSKNRRFFLGLVRDDGWTWDDVNRLPGDGPKAG